MSFSPNLFLSNMSAKDGPAKPSRFEVILPIPPYVNEAVGNSIIEKIEFLSEDVAPLKANENKNKVKNVL